jgi:hypothetical protein
VVGERLDSQQCTLNEYSLAAAFSIIRAHGPARDAADRSFERALGIPRQAHGVAGLSHPSLAGIEIFFGSVDVRRCDVQNHSAGWL